MIRALVLVLFATTTLASAAPKDDEAKAEKTEAKAEKAPRKAGPDDAKAVAILERIAKGGDRKAAIKELDAIAPNAVEAIGEWLLRSHQTSADERRSVLLSIGAAVPDKSGKFAAPPRQSGKERKEDDEVDWLPKLLERGDSAALGEVIADDAAIRALAATKDMRAAQPIFDAAFSDETMVYRDECGRYLRKLEPWSIPTLTRESDSRVGDRKRYATYQLERIDRQEPNKAFAAAAGSEALTLAIIEAYRTTKIREAVHAMWVKVNDDRPRVREAARAAWAEYITGPPPKPAPKKKLQLPGGKLTKKEKPLWLTYRELADNELRMEANELLGEDYPLEDPSSIDDNETKAPMKIDMVAVTDRLYQHYDAARGKVDGAQWTSAKAMADAGDLAASAGMLDRLLAQNPQRGEREGMATIYFEYGKQLEKGKQYADAAAAFSKAHGLDPKGAKANDALAAHYYMLGKSLEASGKDGGPDFRRAIALKPDYDAAADAEADSPSGTGAGKKPTWMIYAAILAAAVAMGLFAAAMLRRRRA